MSPTTKNIGLDSWIYIAASVKKNNNKSEGKNQKWSGFICDILSVLCISSGDYINIVNLNFLFCAHNEDPPYILIGYIFCITNKSTGKICTSRARADKANVKICFAR